MKYWLQERIESGDMEMLYEKSCAIYNKLKIQEDAWQNQLILI